MRLAVGFFFSATFAHAIEAASVDQQPGRPNILLIVADDLGYSDLGVYGGEIDTPNLNALADSGLQLTDFHAAPACSPTRAQLMSGMDNHRAGLGLMAETRSPHLGKPGYEGFLNFRVAAMPELLADAGYHTYMTGKWHLGFEPEQLPSARGFDKTFALLGGGAHHLDDTSVYGPGGAGTTKARYREDGEVATVPDGFYSTRFFTDQLIKYIDANKSSNRPFFGYLSYTAPHWPLQAPKASIDKYAHRYDKGYDALREERIARMRKLGLVPSAAAYHARPDTISPWNELSDQQQRVKAREMEIYAAMVDDIDRHVGRLFDYLKSIDEFDNTLIVFISDNGPAKSTADNMPPIIRDWYEACCDLSYENMGGPLSWVFYGVSWAMPGAGHLRATKGHVSEGGTRVPAIIHVPGNNRGGARMDGFATVQDLLPTFLDLAGTTHPGSEYKGKRVLPMQGESLWPALTGQADAFHADDYVVGWEFEGAGALRQGDWKLLQESAPFGDMSFQLYNLAEDPGEFHDVAGLYPQKFKQMMQLWERYREDNGVIDITLH